MYEQYTLSKTKITLCALALAGMLIGYDHIVHRVSAQDAQIPSAGVESISIINKIEAIKLDTSLLNDDAFNSLVDFSQELTPESVGRPNPFAPINKGR
jgi:hypothetical protein